MHRLSVSSGLAKIICDIPNGIFSKFTFPDNICLFTASIILCKAGSDLITALITSCFLFPVNLLISSRETKSRYFNNGEDWESCAFRVADSIASVEKDKKLYTEKFHNMIYNMDFLPGGRILRNASRAKGSLLNCYVLPIDDSIEDIGTYISNALRLWSEGGGCGANFSLLRPRGDSILGKGGHSSGMVSFIKAADVVSKTIESGGQRRAAALACCDVSHPEIIDFINKPKLDIVVPK